jgi:predicted PurR-regulated permease PerM
MEIPLKDAPLKSKQRFSALEVLKYTVLISVILYFGKALFIPLSFGLLISFILYPFCKWMEKKGINKSAAIFIGIFGLTILLGAIIFLLILQLAEFTSDWQLIKEKLMEAQSQLSVLITEKLGITSKNQLEFFKKYTGGLSSKILSFLPGFIYSFSQSVISLVLIPVFATLLLVYRQMLALVLKRILPSDNGKTSHDILIETVQAYSNFIKGMMIVYLIVGTLNSIGLFLIGVPHPFLFGFIASILTFIPYVGIMIASLLPITVSWIEFNSILYPIGVIVVFAIVQFLEAYIIFPYAVGNRLRINTLAIMVTIVIGGILWGAAGMILFIPFVSIVKLIADRSENPSDFKS